MPERGDVHRIQPKQVWLSPSEVHLYCAICGKSRSDAKKAIGPPDVNRGVSEWVAVKEVSLSYCIGETLLDLLDAYIYKHTHYGSLI